MSCGVSFLFYIFIEFTGGDEDDNDDDEEEEEDGEDDEEEEEDDEDAEDEEEENQRRYDLRQRKTVVRYQAPLDGMLSIQSCGSSSWLTRIIAWIAFVLSFCTVEGCFLFFCRTERDQEAQHVLQGPLLIYQAQVQIQLHSPEEPLQQEENQQVSVTARLPNITLYIQHMQE